MEKPRVWVVETRVKSSSTGRWLSWEPACYYRRRSAAWSWQRKLRKDAAYWIRYRVKPWVREG